MAVLKTASPNVSPAAPNAGPAEHRAVLEREQRRRALLHLRPHLGLISGLHRLGSSLGLPVGNDEVAPIAACGHPPSQRSCRGTALLRLLDAKGGSTDPRRSGIEHDEVRRAARLDRTAVLGGAEDPRRRPWTSPRSRGRAAGGPARRDAVSDGRERGLQPDGARAATGRTPPPSPRPRAARGPWRRRRSSRRPAPRRSASRSSAVRSGGLTLKFVS